MSRRDDGGPAFPRAGYHPDDTAERMDHRERMDLHTDPQGGMTLRDYFAAAALTGLIARRVTASADSLAEQAYELADAMVCRRGA